jgi:hypothetical protein
MSTATPYPARPLVRPESEIPYAQPTDSAGFIYPSYRAARTASHRDKPSLMNPRQPVAYVSSSIGGSLSTLSFEDNDMETYATPHTNHVRAIRGRIRGFSRASRRNLLRCLASINRGAFRALKGRLVSITLTYPHEYPEDPVVCKNHLKALRKRLQRTCGDFAGFWRLGIQRRGAFHFHVLLFVPPSFISVRELRSFVSWSWYEICGQISEGHLLAGTRVEEIRTWRKVTSYAEKYLAREEHFPQDLQTGRIWGMWNPKLLPVRWETVEVSLRDAFRIRRIYRKLARRKGSGSLRRITVFVRYENVIRLLEILGYCLN